MSAVVAIKKFCGSPGNNPEMIYPDVGMKELKSFKESCSEQEWAEFGQHAEEALTKGGK